MSGWDVRRIVRGFVLGAVLALAVPIGFELPSNIPATIPLRVPTALAQYFQPHEPLNPAKAQSLPTSPLTIEQNGKTFKFTVELADTDKEREIGLMHRNQLAEDRGMLFNFYTEQQLSFWMRNTFIPLDMLFIHKDGKVEFIAQNVQPHDERPVGPRTPVLAVLEVPAGTAARLGLTPGAVVHHAIFKNVTP